MMRRNRFVNPAFAVAVLILMAIGGFAHWCAVEMQTVMIARGAVRQGVLDLERLLSLVKDAETGQRGFLLTGRDAYLAPYDAAVDAVHRQIDVVTAALASRDEAKVLLARIVPLVEAKLAELEETVAMRRAGQEEGAKAVVLTDRGKIAMDELRKVVGELQAIEMEQLKRLGETADSRVLFSRVTVPVGMALALIIVAMAGALLASNERRRHAAEAELKQAFSEREEAIAALQRQTATLGAVVTAQQAVATAGLEVQQVLDLVVRQARDLTDADGGIIELADGDDLVYRAAVGTAAANLGLRLKRDGSFSGLCLAERRAIRCDDAETDPRVNIEACRRVGVGSMICVPLMHDGKAIGVLKTYCKSPHRFTDVHTRTLELVAGLLAAATGQATAFEALRQTERELTKARDAANAAAQAKAAFLANMSHEIRTPINGVLGMTTLLLDTPLSVDGRDYVDSIRRSGEALLAIVNDVLDLSKIDAGRLDLETIDFDVVSTVQDLQRMFGHVVRTAGLTLTVEVAEGLPLYVKGDPGRLRQVLINLIGNAVKFTKKGGVTLRVKPERTTGSGTSLRFEISDTGIGIPTDVQGKLFQTFTQGDSSTTRRFGGTGLGLSICKRLVELMGGTIGVESVQGSGSTFWFSVTLQAGARPQDLIVTAPSAATISANETFRILVAEDNAINQKIAIRLLEKLGFRVHAVGNGKEAVDALREASYDLVLMDCQMPEMDGYEATGVIRSDNREDVRGIPIIAMTANAMAGDAERCLAAGMSDYLSKPIDLKKLDAVLQRWTKVAEERRGLSAA